MHNVCVCVPMSAESDCVRAAACAIPTPWQSCAIITIYLYEKEHAETARGEVALGWLVIRKMCARVTAFSLKF